MYVGILWLEQNITVRDDDAVWWVIPSLRMSLLISSIKVPIDWFASTAILWNCFNSSSVAPFLKKKSSFSCGRCTSNISVSQFNVMCTWVTCSNELRIVDTAFTVNVWRSTNFNESQINKFSPQLLNCICQFCDVSVQALSNSHHSMKPVLTFSQCV